MMFITTNTLRRRPVFADAAYACEAAETIYRVQELHPFLLYAFVIMPDHCHFLLNVPPPESISKIMNIYKSGVSHNIGIGKIWQSRFDLKIADNSMNVLRYIHENPVKAGIVDLASKYLWSSASGKWEVTSLSYW